MSAKYLENATFKEGESECGTVFFSIDKTRNNFCDMYNHIEIKKQYRGSECQK
jgi:hypothetical protein